jgi:putative oxidoreductase
MASFFNNIERLIARPQDFFALIGRIMVAIFFLYAGIFKIQNYAHETQMMETNNVAAWFLPLVIMLEIGGSITMTLGFLTRLTALCWAVFALIAGTIFDLSILDTAGSPAWARFWEDVSIAGGLFVIAAFGGGRWSVDALVARRAG